MQAVLTRKRSGCSASATSVEGSRFAVHRPPAQSGGLSEQSRFCSSRRLLMQERLAANGIQAGHHRERAVLYIHKWLLTNNL